MDEVLGRLQCLRPVVQEICQSSGTAGASIGILYQGHVLMTDNFGFRDIEARIPPDDQTIYYLASLSKSFTTAAVALLVHQGKLEWNTPVSNLLPILQHPDQNVRESASILDFLSHRTGLAPKNHLWSQEFGYMSLARGETLRTVPYLEAIAPLRTRWIYNNWGYGVADFLIEKLTEHSWGSFLARHVFEPLKMGRTGTDQQPNVDNVAEAYVCLSNGNQYHLPHPDGGDGDIIGGAIGVRSCVHDLLKYYSAFLKTVNEQDGSTAPGKVHTPFVDVKTMLDSQVQLSTKSPELDGSYGLGWVNAQLPCTLGAIGLNRDILDKMPVVGKGLEAPQRCIYHQGSANAFLCSVYLLPETQSGVVVLTNSMSKNDTADWLGQAYLETLIDNPIKNDYLRIAKDSATAASRRWPDMVRELAVVQVPNTTCRLLDEYVGRYSNIIGNYQIEVVLFADETLLIRFQRHRSIAYALTHYHYDSFSWLSTHNQSIRVGRFPITRASFYLFHFQARTGNGGPIDSLVWAHDDEVLAGETFYKQ